MNAMNKTFKILTVLLIAIFALAPLVFALPVDVNPDTSGAEDVSDIGNQIAGIVQVVGIFAAVIIIMVIGIKYMMGSAEEKAEYKKVMIPYLVGALLLFAASVFVTKIYDWVTTSIN